MQDQEAIIYARQSTRPHDQDCAYVAAEDTTTKLDEQEKACRSFCEENGVEVVAIYSE